MPNPIQRNLLLYLGKILLLNLHYRSIFNSIFAGKCRYPDQYGWQIQITRNDIRKSEVYFRLHNFLNSETKSGNISRQEVVSMIPPILLNVESHHKVSFLRLSWLVL